MRALWAPLGAVPLGHAVAGEVAYSEFGAERLGLFVVALVEKPDVQGPVWVIRDSALESGAHHGEGFLSRDVGGEEGDPGALLGYDGDGVAGDHRRVGDAHDVDEHEEFDQSDDDEHRGVESDSQRSPPSRSTQWVGHTR